MNFSDIPLKDIKYLLSNQPLKDNIYLQAWNFIISNPNILVPKSIADWVTVYNLQNKFKDLPDEIVVKILLELDYKQLQSLCNLSTQFKNICDSQIINILKERLTDKGYYVKNINNLKQLINVIRMTELNGRTLKSYGKDYVVDPNGNVKIITYADDFSDEYLVFDTEDVPNGNNIIGLVYGHGGILILLRNDGKVLIYNQNKQVTELVDTYKNIIQVVYFRDYFYFLGANGDVYKSSDKEKTPIFVIRNISKIVKNNYQMLFLTNNGEIYDETNKLFQGIREIKSIDNIFFVIDRENNLHKIDNTMKYLHKINNINNVKKLYQKGDYLVILTNNGNLYIYPYNKYNFESNIIPTEIKDDVVDMSQIFPLLIKTFTNELYELEIRSDENYDFKKINVEGEIIGNNYFLMNGDIYKYVKKGVTLKVLSRKEDIVLSDTN